MSVANSYRQMVIERRQSYSNFIPFSDKILTDFAKRAKKAGMSFDQYQKFVKGTFKDGADEGRAIIKGREIFKDKEDGRTKLSGAQAKRDNIARRAALRKRLGIPEHHEKDANGEPIPHDDEEGNELNEVSTLVTKQWQMFSKDIMQLVKFMSSPDGMDLDDKRMKAFLIDMEKTLNKHLMKNDIKM